MLFDEMYWLQHGKLIKNTDKKVKYTDKNGREFVVTNPRMSDYKKVGKKKAVFAGFPEYISHAQYVNEKIEEKEDCFLVSYEICERK